MGVAKDTLLEFIDSIPDHELEAFPPLTGTMHSDNNYRLDNEGVSAKRLKSG